MNTWGNLVNRVLAMTARNAGGRVPPAADLNHRDSALLATIDTALAEAGAQLETVELRAALRTLMAAAQETNAYLNQTAPWKTAADDPQRTATTLHVALGAINGLKTGFAPFLPFTSTTLHALLGQEGSLEEQGWQRTPLRSGTMLPPPAPLFTKIDGTALE